MLSSLGTSPVRNRAFFNKKLNKIGRANQTVARRDFAKSMLDLKTFKSALEQLEEERKIPKEKILEAIEQAMAAAYKKDYGKKGQIIRAKFDLETGKTDFFQVKIVVDESIAILDRKEIRKSTKARYSVKE